MYKHASFSNAVQNLMFAGSPRRGTIGFNFFEKPAFSYEDRSMLQPSAIPGLPLRSNKFRPLAPPAADTTTYVVRCFDLVDPALYEQVKVEHAAAKLKPAPVQLATGVMVRRRSVTAQVQLAA